MGCFELVLAHHPNPRPLPPLRGVQFHTSQRSVWSSISHERAKLSCSPPMMGRTNSTFWTIRSRPMVQSLANRCNVAMLGQATAPRTSIIEREGWPAVKLSFKAKVCHILRLCWRFGFSSLLWETHLPRRLYRSRRTRRGSWGTRDMFLKIRIPQTTGLAFMKRPSMRDDIALIRTLHGPPRRKRSLCARLVYPLYLLRVVVSRPSIMN